MKKFRTTALFVLAILAFLLVGGTTFAQPNSEQLEAKPEATPTLEGRASDLAALRDDLVNTKAKYEGLKQELTDLSKGKTIIAPAVWGPLLLELGNLEQELERTSAGITTLVELEQARVSEQVDPEEPEPESEPEPHEDATALQRTEWLVIVAIVLGLANLAFLWHRLPARTQAPHSDIHEAPPPPSQVPSLKIPSIAEQKPRTVEAPGPRSVAAVPAVDTGPALDEFESIPHGRIGRLLSQMQEAAAIWSPKLSEVRDAERFVRDLGQPLGARIQRFKEAALRGDSYLEQNWLEQDLVTTLNTLSELLSFAIEERHRGGRVGRSVEGELRRWLYEKLAPACREEGFFVIEEILPFTTRFDAKIHRAVETKTIEGAENLVIGIKLIGRRDARSKEVTHKAEVVVGR